MTGVTLVVKDDPHPPAAIAFDYLLPSQEQGLMFAAVVEYLDDENAWVEIPPEEVAIEMRRFPPPGETRRSGARMVVAPRRGLMPGSYRARVSAHLSGDSEAAAITKTFALQVLPPAAAAKSSGEMSSVVFERTFPGRYETWEAASDSVGGRFPGGQNMLFHGLWHDPVTGLAYARNRWYDPRNASWLSEDALGSVDSPNLYAFVGWQPNTYADPLGLRKRTPEDEAAIARLQGRVDRFTNMYRTDGISGVTFIEAEIGHPWYAPSQPELQYRPRSCLATDPSSFATLRSRLQSEVDSYVAAVAEAGDFDPIAFSGLSGTYYVTTAEEWAGLQRTAASIQLGQIAIDLAGAKAARAGGGSTRTMARRGGPRSSAALRNPELPAIGTKPSPAPTTGAVLGKLALYPQVVDPRTGRNIPFPSGVVSRVPKSERAAPLTPQERQAYIAAWHRRGYERPRGGWDKYDLHHIQPREFGGKHEFWNIVPVERGTHQQQFNAFWRDFGGL